MDTKLYDHLESFENIRDVIMPRWAFLTTVCARILEECKTKMSPSIVPLQFKQSPYRKKQKEMWIC